MSVRFDDLDDLNDSGTSSMTKLPESITDFGSIHIEACPKCRGSGRWLSYSGRVGGNCFKCKGTGKLQFKNDAATRAKQRAGAAERKVVKAINRFEAFEAAHPDIAAWWNSTDFAYAGAMKEAVRKYGDLTGPQIAGVYRCIEANERRKAAQAQRVEAAPAVRIDHVATALQNAKGKGVNKPKLRLAGDTHAFVFTLAPMHGKNAGAIYVNDKETETYLGKIVDGKFIRSRDCTDMIETEIITACANPEQAAIAYGKRFGICSCCGRLLTNALSIQLGIGPICREKYF